MEQPSDTSVPYDPVSLEIMWGKLTSIVDEAAAALVRSSFSTIVRESNDYCCGLLDAQARSLAESSYSIPLFMGTLSRTVQHFLAQFPAETWRPGDVVITNDPWMGTGHRPDITCTAGWSPSPPMSRTRPTSAVSSGRRTPVTCSRKV